MPLRTVESTRLDRQIADRIAALIDALARRDPDAARAAMRRCRGRRGAA